MIRLLWRIALVIVCGLGLAWLANRPGSIAIHWMGRDIELSVLVGLALFALAFCVALAVYWVLHKIWTAPAAIGANWRARKVRKAYESLSQGIIAAGAGDGAAAQRHANIAGETLKHEPLVHLLGAQAAQLRGDKAAVHKVFTDMAAKPETRLLGLRGLYAHAREAGDWHGARSHAEAAHGSNGKLAWASQAMLQSHIAHKDWIAAAKTIGQQVKAGTLAKAEGVPKQAAMLTAAALPEEDVNPDDAKQLAAEAHKLDPALVPAAALLARRHIADGELRKAKRVLSTTFSRNPHRELAALAASLHPDDAEAAFEQVRELTGKEPDSDEARFALAQAAVKAGRNAAAKEVLKPLIDAGPAVSVCGLMATIEEAGGNAEEAKAWLKRALAAPRDAVWVSDGVGSPQWMPVSPVTGEIVPCEWRMVQGPAVTALLPKAQAKTSTKTTLPRPPDDPGVEG